ncbi:chemotaxis protein CheD [Pendulispora albinea]|uniref:Probable chemoreceptor glutamine deamidase CheD n=1 Tax=Pendulispora albinea TaxID=2741071 RepID=A0ABZ2LQC4_9BACT
MTQYSHRLRLAHGHANDESPVSEEGPASGLRSVYVHPGQMFASSVPHAITTILGSCVAVCLWDPRTGAGGMNHYVLPYRVLDQGRSGRFGDVALRSLVERMESLGAARSDLSAKVFGGASLLGDAKPPREPIGAKNVALALDMLKDAGIQVVAKDVYGDTGRKLVFHTNDGTAWVRRL